MKYEKKGLASNFSSDIVKDTTTQIKTQRDTEPLFPTESLETDNSPTSSEIVLTGILGGNLNSLSSITPAYSLLPDKECDICNGTGRMLKENGKKTECICILQKELAQYLTIKYANADKIPNFDTTPFKGKNLLLQNMSVEVFRSIVRAFLTLTGQKYKHLTVSGQELFNLHYKDAEQRGFTAASEIDFLIIFLSMEPVNKSYGQIITSMLEKRILNDKITWIYHRDGVESRNFASVYTTTLSNYILQHFQKPNYGKK